MKLLRCNCYGHHAAGAFERVLFPPLKLGSIIVHDVIAALCRKHWLKAMPAIHPVLTPEMEVQFIHAGGSI